MKRNQLLSASLLVLGFLLGASALSTFAAGSWTPPACNDGGNCNTDAPINVGTSTQTKIGNLSISGLLADGSKAQYALTVEGGSIWAKNGFIVESRAADPVSPEVGRIWLVQ